MSELSWQYKAFEWIKRNYLCVIKINKTLDYIDFTVLNDLNDIIVYRWYKQGYRELR